MPKNSIQNTSYTENENNKTSESTSEDYDILVVDWKNMSPIKITNISELQIYDMIQFKVSIIIIKYYILIYDCVVNISVAYYLRLI